MSVLLTGHEGFIGQNVKIELESIGYSVVGIERGEVREVLTNKIEDIVKEVEFVLHVGAISDTSLQDYHEMLFYNYHFTKSLVDVCKKYNKRIVYSSSASVYGDGDVNSVPNNIYAWSKLLGEEYGRLSYPSGFTSLRYFNVYGPHEDHKGKMSSIGYQAWLSRDEGVFKLFPKKPTRDFIYVKDVVSANLCAVKEVCGVYDVGYGESHSFEDFLYHMGIDDYIYVSEDKIPEWYQYFTQADKDNRVPNWKPMYDIKLGCEDYLKHLSDG